MQKSFFVLLALSFALVVPQQVAQFITHSQAGVGVAWAQDADDSADVSAAKVVPPDVAGDWTGTVTDETASSPFTVEIFQKHSNIKGSYTTEAGMGTFKGKIDANGTTVVLKLKQNHSKCRVTANGTLTEPAPADQVAGVVAQPEISGSYTVKHCDITPGTFSITLNPSDD
jgi:hypothetical protein